MIFGAPHNVNDVTVVGSGTTAVRDTFAILNAWWINTDDPSEPVLQRYNGSAWVNVGSTDPTLPAWALSGNALAGTEKLGSTNNFPVNFYVNDLNKMRLYTTGNLLLNRAGGNPAAFNAAYVFNGAEQVAEFYDTDNNPPFQKLVTIVNNASSAANGPLRRVGYTLQLGNITDSGEVRKTAALTYEGTQPGAGDAKMYLWTGDGSNACEKRVEISTSLFTTLVNQQIQKTLAGGLGPVLELFNNSANAGTYGRIRFLAGDRVVAAIDMLRTASTNGPGNIIFSVRESDAIGLVEKIRITNTGQIGQFVAAPNAAAALQTDSTTQGWLPPRMTTTQRDAITAVAGLMIYNTTTNKHQGYDGTSWNDFY